MGSIYRHSSLNIASTGFKDGENGLFVQRNPELLRPIALSVINRAQEQEEDQKRHLQRDLGSGNYYLVDTTTWRHGVEDAPLCGRGWVTQERALSVRTIHFGREQVLWECLTTNATEVFPKGLLRGTEIKHPKVLLESRAQHIQRKMDRLRDIRNCRLEFQNIKEDFQAQMKEIKAKYSMPDDTSSDDEDDEDAGSNDGDFVRRFQSLLIAKNNNASPNRPKSRRDEPEPDSDSDFIQALDCVAETSTSEAKQRNSRIGILQDLGLELRDLEGCDLSVLDGLKIKGWEKLKQTLTDWGFGAGQLRIEPLPVRGMVLTLRQWTMVVSIYSRCSLSFSRDKLVAISGLAQSLSQDLKCDYLAGLWRKDLEHQLLWKVIKPLPAPKKDGTRGPSWSWASVDGAVEIPEWDGYFYE
jgi:hypothetical protein